jgi:hypothetical protein
MTARHRGAIAAFALVATLGLAACGSSGGSDAASKSATQTTSTTSTTAPPSAPVGSTDATTAAGLTAADAQSILRKVLDPATPPATAVALVYPSQSGTVVSALAKGFSAAGYTPDKFVVKSVAVSGDTGTAQVAVSSPHAPQPVTIPLTFTNSAQGWRLSGVSFSSLAKMGSQYGGQ